MTRALALPTPKSKQRVGKPPTFDQQQHTLGELPSEDEIPVAKAAFRDGWKNAPHPADVTGSHVLEWTFADEVPDTLRNTRHPQTFQHHRKFLRMLQAFLRNSEPDWQRHALVVIAVRLLETLADLRKWKPQTLFREACSAQGALNSLPVYSDFPQAVNLCKEPMWRLKLEEWGTLSRQAQPHNQAAAGFENIIQAVESVPADDLLTRSALILQWTMAARVGDVLNLRYGDIAWGGLSGPERYNLKVTVKEGKVMRKRDPYTVPTKVTYHVHAEILDRFFKSIEPKSEATPLFPRRQRHSSHQQFLIRKALKQAGANLNTRAIRRGALQVMADNGVSLNVLATFSGHKSEDTLLRYLNWGRNASERTEASQKAAVHLGRSPTSRD